ncbi:hypothetical protein [Liquorilactobacillus vini]|uniref:hypothetical protein n=1 Tax=Liquorilactobacillus vini TaxID=238015 RepID=UPI0003181C18|nr:hypothetical protein [Liquorilactobacillus vini]
MGLFNKLLSKQDPAEIEKYKSLKESFKNSSAQRFNKFYFDSEKKQLFIDKTLTTKYALIDYNDITGYAPIEETHSKNKKHGITRAVVGGALAGGVGAIVGAATGGKNADFVDKLGVVIQTSGNQSFKLMFINVETKKGFITSTAYDQFEKVQALLNGIVNK